MTVNIHIERLLIDGFAFGRHETPIIEAALSAELTRLIGEGALADGLASRRFDPAIRAEPITRASCDAAGLATQIGKAVHGVIGR